METFESMRSRISAALAFPSISLVGRWNPDGGGSYFTATVEGGYLTPDSLMPTVRGLSDHADPIIALTRALQSALESGALLRPRKEKE